MSCTKVNKTHAHTQNIRRLVSSDAKNHFHYLCIHTQGCTGRAFHLCARSCVGVCVFEKLNWETFGSQIRHGNKQTTRRVKENKLFPRFPPLSIYTSVYLSSSSPNGSTLSQSYRNSVAKQKASIKTSLFWNSANLRADANITSSIEYFRTGRLFVVVRFWPPLLSFSFESNLIDFIQQPFAHHSLVAI